MPRRRCVADTGDGVGSMMPTQALAEQELSEAVVTTERRGCEAGQGLAEYAILLMTLSVVMVTILTSIGSTVSTLYIRISRAFPVL